MTTLKNIDLTDQNAFTYNSDEVLIDATGASLILRSLYENETLFATGKVTQNADLGSNLPIYLRGTALWTNTENYDLKDISGNGFFSLSDDSLIDGVNELLDNEHFNFIDDGCVRFKIKIPYDQTPANERYIFTTGNSAVLSGLGSLISLKHKADGQLNLVTYSEDGLEFESVDIGEWLPVQNSTVEIEFNYDEENTYFSLFIDGALLGGGIVKENTANRDYFYFGTFNDGAATWVSECEISDIQIFNTVQHVEDFFLEEIPRIVGIYPTSSKIYSLEESSISSIAEFLHLETSILTAYAQYILRLDGVEYWVNGDGDVVESTSNDESNTVSQIETNLAAINTFIGQSKTIQMLPVLFSGPDALDTPLLEEFSLEYSFYNLVKDCITCRVSGYVKDNCEDILSGKVKIESYGAIITQGKLATIEVEKDIVVPTGYFEIDVIIPNLKIARTGTTPSLRSETDDLFKFSATWEDVDGATHKVDRQIRVPDEDNVTLGDIIVL